MDVEQSITRLIGLARDGRAEAAEQLWAAYFQKLVAVAHRKLAAAPRAAADEEDLALSAFKSFWNGVRGDRFPHLTDRTSLWPLLVAITTNKCVDHIRHQSRKKRGDPSAQVVGIEDIVSREPNPELAGELADHLEHLLVCLDRTNDGTLRRVAEMRLRGDTTTEIADSLGCAKRTVERKLVIIEQCWATEAARESGQ